MISISAATFDDKNDKAVITMQLRVQLQGLNLIFMVDSGSTHSFLDSALLSKLQGIVRMPKVLVKIANGDTIACDIKVCDCTWSCSRRKFISDFRYFPLGSYDGIVGFDWLASHNPMLVDRYCH